MTRIQNILFSILYGRMTFIVMIIAFAARVKPFVPPPSARDLNYLVVDGSIVTGDSTTIRLSRTGNISDSFQVIPETNAHVFIQGQLNGEVSLRETNNGIYTTDGSLITEGDKYRLRIITQNGKEYLSDEVDVKRSPEIDSVEWAQNDDVFIYVNTHDPSGITRYYRWEFEETMEYTAMFDSHLDFRNGEVVFLRPEEYRYTCFKFFTSTDILIGTSAALSDDIIRRALITRVPNDNSKITTRYSILVKQYALSPEAYQYWQILKRNTEQTGGIFDPQPAQLSSNIRCTSDPNEPVIGFVSASSVSQKRIFIRHGQLQDRTTPTYGLMCTETFISPDDAGNHLSDGTMLPAYFTTRGGLAIAPAKCIDCRMQGGILQKPSYW